MMRRHHMHLLGATMLLIFRESIPYDLKYHVLLFTLRRTIKDIESRGSATPGPSPKEEMKHFLLSAFYLEFGRQSDHLLTLRE